MVQPDCCCRLTRAEINGIVASGCACGDRRASMKLSWFHMMSISTSWASHVAFERSGSAWTKFQTQCNLWKRKKTPVSYKLSEAPRLNSRFCLCLIPKPSKSMVHPDCCCRLTRAEINGIVASGCVWRPPSLHENYLDSIWCPSPLPELHMLLLKDLVLLEPNSKLSATYETEKNTRLIQVIWSPEIKTAVSVFVWFPSPPNQWCNRTVAAGWHGLR